jgi:hypothetical protein
MRWRLLVFLVVGSVLAIPCAPLARADDLVSCLPEAPEPMETPGFALPFHLHERNYPVIPVRAVHLGETVAPVDGVNLCDQYFGARRLLTLDEDYAPDLNAYLAGRSSPVLEGMIGILADVGAGAAELPLVGPLLAVFQIARKSMVTDTDIRVRVNDQIWRVDLAAVEEGRPTYIFWYVLVDPYREQCWMLDEARVPIVLGD